MAVTIQEMIDAYELGRTGQSTNPWGDEQDVWVAMNKAGKGNAGSPEWLAWATKYELDKMFRAGTAQWVLEQKVARELRMLNKSFVKEDKRRVRMQKKKGTH